jgi:hypothetical protein
VYFSQSLEIENNDLKRDHGMAFQNFLRQSYVHSRLGRFKFKNWPKKKVKKTVNPSNDRKKLGSYLENTTQFNTPAIIKSMSLRETEVAVSIPWNKPVRFIYAPKATRMSRTHQLNWRVENQLPVSANRWLQLFKVKNHKNANKSTISEARGKKWAQIWNS